MDIDHVFLIYSSWDGYLSCFYFGATGTILHIWVFVWTTAFNSSWVVVVFQLLSRVQLFGTPWTAARQASWSFTISLSLLKFMAIELVMLSNLFILCCPLLLLFSFFPSTRVFSNELLLASSGQSIGASASVLPKNIQGWFRIGLTGLISLLLFDFLAFIPLGCICRNKIPGSYSCLCWNFWETAT